MTFTADGEVLDWPDDDVAVAVLESVLSPSTVSDRNTPRLIRSIPEYEYEFDDTGVEEGVAVEVEVMTV